MAISLFLATREVAEFHRDKPFLKERPCLVTVTQQ